MNNIVYFDLEVSNNGKILDIGAVNQNGDIFHSSALGEFLKFISSAEYLCGHNIVSHDINYLKPFLKKSYKLIDTLYLSPILFPERPYHNLVKDDKILSDQLNNPLSDSLKARQLFEDELERFKCLPENVKRAYFSLLNENSHFKGFFDFAQYSSSRISYIFNSKADNISDILEGMVCRKASISSIIDSNPTELAYAIAIIRTGDRYSITPAWVKHQYPLIDNIIYKLRGTNCGECKYCREHLDARKMLKRWFGYDGFRTFNGESLQEDAVNAAIQGKSLLAIFPTGGGKSLTFQLPALIAGEATKALTVVISPLQSLMKDQVENLEKRSIAEAVYINGLLSPIERQQAFERVMSGDVSLLYIAPEQLRSKTLERALLSRTINRFVIDEAHCFSAWGQDFRIEYQYIGEFLRDIQHKKGLEKPIAVSCFTATARPKVISDIIDYFDRTNGIALEKFTTTATRTNLRYTVLHRDNKNEKYSTLRSLLQSKNCPSIVYVARTKSAEQIAEQLRNDGLDARAFHGQMDTMIKVKNQEDFINNKVRIIVATSAFGMGVDKSDVGLVIHYDISDSLENYLQEAGRAGRDVHTEADCYVLYNDNDLNKHFILLNQTKLTLSEINQIWRAIKSLTKNRKTIFISPLEVARKAGWEEMMDIETKVKSAINALETAGYVRRGMNSPRIFATSIIPKCFEDAAQCLDTYGEMTEEERVNCKRIIKSLISQKSRASAGTNEAESRVDYLSDMLGIETSKVIQAIESMRSAGILTRDNDMTAYLRKKLVSELGYYVKLEQFLLSYINENGAAIDLKTFNEYAIENGIKKSKLKDIKTLIFFWQIQDYAQKAVRQNDMDKMNLILCDNASRLQERLNTRAEVCMFIISEMEKMENLTPMQEYATVNFSMSALLEKYNSTSSLYNHQIKTENIQEALLFLSKTGIISIEGGFMVIYNKLELERIADNNLKYKKEDYKNLDAFYKQRIQQIHIVGEFANMVVKDYDKAMIFIKDYFFMEFKAFVKKYFDSDRQKEITQNVSPKKYNEIFGSLTETQHKIISDKESRFIVVPAGPGSGKTYVLVRKLASLILMEDIKSEKLLMLTFSRAAASEFKKRLTELIGNAAKYVEIKTFHSYCFDILGQRGTLEKSEDIVKAATREIISNRVEISRITKSILVIDEAQDMSADEFSLVEALINRNEDIRVIAVGDDDQNIYAFRGSDSMHLKLLLTRYGGVQYNMLENFRSHKRIITCANDFTRCIPNRLKSSPIIATHTEEGSVRFTLHQCENYEEAIVKDIMSRKPNGTTGVLTSRNEDALIIAARLNKNGRKARLIQSNEGFSLSDLAELHIFISIIKEQTTSVISEALWENSKQQICARFRNSTDLNTALRCIDAFETEYGTKYVSDLENFILESDISDFDERRQEEIIVSTIHKSKGHEYDNVFISLKGMHYISDEEKRAIYVGITRARNTLSVHSNVDLSQYVNLISADFMVDAKTYAEPDEVLMQLTHRDVILSKFKGKVNLIDSLYAGQEININDNYAEVFIGNRPVKILKFSEAFRRKISQLAEKGYHPHMAKIRHIVYWRDEDIEAGEGKIIEIPIVLPEIIFKKR